MQCSSFNRDWRYAPQSDGFLGAPTEDYRPADLPFDAMLHETRDPHMAGGVHTGYYPPLSCEFIKEFAFDPAWKGKTVQLLFEGVYMAAKVFVNHMPVYEHGYGYTPFTVDLTQYLDEAGPNAIKVICRSYRDSRWYSGAGIYRDVWLLVSDPVHIVHRSAAVTTKELLPEYAVLEAEVRLKNETQRMQERRLSFTVKDPAGQTVWTYALKVTLFAGEQRPVRQRIELNRPQCWDVDHPDLYSLTVALSGEADADTEETSFGIRLLSLSRHEGLKLNGRHVQLRGSCIHHDNGILGACEYPEAAERRVRRLKAAGVNAIRMAHHPASRALLDACDRVGMLVMNEAFDTWVSNKNPYDYGLYFESCWERDVEALVETSRSHPSVILYSTGNEIIECGNPKGAQLAAMLGDRLRALDPSRYTILCLNILLCCADFSPEQGEALSSDVNAEMTEKQNVFKQLILKPEIAALVEEASAGADIVGYNYGDSRYVPDMELHPDRLLCGSETFPADLAGNWAMVRQYPQILGDFNWTGWDYLGEVGIGRVAYAGEEQKLLRSAYCGDFDLTGHRRAQSWYREAVWGLAPHPWIAVQHPAKYQKELPPSPWAFFDGSDCWDYPGFQGAPAAVQVYADAEEAELFLNGVSVARKPVAAYVAEFTVSWQPGTLCAVAYRGGKAVSEWSLYSGTGKTGIVSFWETPPDAAERLCYFAIENQYENGVLDRETPVRVSVSVEHGTLLGLGSADPAGSETFLTDVCDLFEGRALAAVRATSQTKVTVTPQE